jgi:TPP-dependent pyruvate/acetoin dehydrogenase alpha subunit
LIPHEKLIALYTSMLKCRLAAEAAGTQSSGEAAYAAAPADLQRKDTLHAAPRHALARLTRGAATARTIAALKRARRARNGSAEMLAKAVDAARRHKAAKNKSIAMVFAGDAEAPAGAWKKSLAAAAKRSLPVLFVSMRTAGEAPAFLDTETIPTEAIAFGVPIITVDGNDAVAVYRVAYESLSRARDLSNPTLIDCLCKTGDGVKTMETWLGTRGLLTPYKKRAITATVRSEFTQASSSHTGTSKEKQ